MNTLKEAARKYTTLDIELEEGKGQLATLFIGQSSDDIQRKLQKLQGAEARDIGKMLDIAWVIYRNRDQQKEKGNAKLMAALETIQLYQKGARGVPRGNMRGVIRGRGRRRGLLNPTVGQHQCAYCKKEGHWKRECPALLEGKGEGVPIVPIEDED